MISVLAIDGGGIRGIIPAMVLDQIEERTEKPISELFDLIAGTSTGGILALGLTKPGNDDKPQYTAKQLIDLYEAEGENIFYRSICHRINALGNIAEEKYSSDGIESVLHKYFGEARLQQALTEVLVPSYDIERRNPWFFRSRYARDPKKKGFDFSMGEVARATSAAPTYFEPFKLDAEGPEGYYALVDGGVFANNPAMCAYVEARRTYKNENDFLVASLGTGELTRKLPYEEAIGWGLALWAQPILNVVFDGVSDTVDFQLRELLLPEDGPRRYYRFQTELDIGKDDMDDASSTNIYALKTKAQEIIRRNDNDLDALCAQLLERQ